MCSSIVRLYQLHLLLTLPWRWQKKKKPAYGKVKREDWNGRKREKIGQMCSSTETRGCWTGLWSKSGVNCTALIKQSITEWSLKDSSIPKNVPTLDPTNSRYLRWIIQDWHLDYFFPYINLMTYSPAVLPCSQNWKKALREWQFWFEGKLIMVWGRRWGSFLK